MATMLPVRVPSSQPTGFLASVATHPNVVAMKQALNDAFEYLKQLWERVRQNVVWAWRALVDGGAMHASLAIEAASGVAHAVLPDKVAAFGRTAALHGRAWWLTIRRAIDAAEHQSQNQKSEAEKAELRKERDEAIAARDALSQQQRADYAAFELEKTRLSQSSGLTPRQQVELNSVQEENADLKQKLDKATSRAEKAESENAELRQQVELLQNDKLPNPYRKALADALTDLRQATAVNHNVAEAYQAVIQKAADLYAKQKQVLKMSSVQSPLEAITDEMMEIGKVPGLAAKLQVDILPILQERQPAAYEDVISFITNSTNQS